MTERKEKHKQKQKERGITLIALVITIIVLLILAGVALAALTGDSGILNNAEKAKENTNLANTEEQIKLAVQGALLEEVSKTGKMEITEGNLKNELNNIVGTEKYQIKEEEKSNSWTVTVGDYNATVSKNGSLEKALPTANGTKPWLPDGFSQVEGTDLSNGLTITNATGLQNYVWIEVPTTISATVIRNGENIAVNLEDAQNDSEILQILETYAGYYKKGKDEWYDSTGKKKNTEGANENDDKGCGMTCSQFETSYSNMLNSIKKYGGFWLAQYEAGIEYEEQGEKTTTNRKEHSDINIAKANYTKDQYPYNWIYFNEAQKIANEDSTDKYTSNLPFGIQWDLVCKFLDVKTDLEYADISTNSKWGNYSNTSWISSSNSKRIEQYGTSFKEGAFEKTSEIYLLTTGAIDKVKVDSIEYVANPMNIYDFAGNLWEYTFGYYNTSSPCVVRGGSFANPGSGHPASAKGGYGINGGDQHVGFRSTLY